MSKSKLIMLNGFAGCGKSTIAKKYISEHPLSMNLEGDQIIVMLGEWKENWDEASKCKIELTKTMAATHLGLGYDVVIPFLLTKEKDAEDFEKIAEETGANFFEIVLSVNREEAIARLLKRGRWGEEGSSTFTEKDYSDIEELYNSMIEATNKRPNTINIFPKEGDIEKTYEDFISILNVGRE
jgi:predicted kinase